MFELIIYTIASLLTLSFGFLLIAKTKKIGEIIFRLLNTTWFYTKTKFGRKSIQVMKANNENRWFLYKQKLVGIIFFFISLVALFILIKKWETFF